MAVSGSLGRPAPLGDVVARLEFVQFDPIRRPARAEDLILHQRVSGYRAGDLGRAYARLGLEEDMLHVYGAMTLELRRLLHPRADRRNPGHEWQPEGVDAEVLAFVRERGAVHPRDLDEPLGRGGAVNAWGGQSAATTRALERLHYYGWLRVLRRDSGVKVYEPTEQPDSGLAPRERLRGLAAHIARMLAPVQESTLRAVVGKARRSVADAPSAASAVKELLADGELSAAAVDGVRYLWPPGLEEAAADVGRSRRVRFLAPFDPVVWDRSRFEHLWGWPYRFEAYTPAPKRQFGYYALPVLFGDRVVGWATAEPGRGGDGLAVDVRGAPGVRLASADFRRGVERETERLGAMVAGRG